MTSALRAVTLLPVRRSPAQRDAAAPAFRDGVGTYARMVQLTTGFVHLVDSLPAPTTILAFDGGVLHENQAMRSLVEGDPERARIHTLVRQAALATANTVSRGQAPDWTKCSRHVEIRTAFATYRITTTVAPEGLLHAGSALVAFTERLTSHSLDSESLASQFGLTSREIQTARLVARGYSTRQIATEMGIAFNTARRHTEHVLLKLNLHSRAAVAARLAGVCQRSG